MAALPASLDAQTTALFAIDSLRKRTKRDPTIQAALRRAEQAFVAANIGLVWAVVRHRFAHIRSAFEPEDLVQEGVFGLMQALERFDVRRGLRFSTYATWWVRHAIGRSLADRGRLVRLPVHLIDRARGTSQEAKAHPLTSAQQELIAAHAVPLDGCFDLAATAASAEEQLVKLQQRRDVLAAVAQLTPRTRRILTRRFGLDGSDGQTLKQIGNDLGLSRERIRQLEGMALLVLKEKMMRTETEQPGIFNIGHASPTPPMPDNIFQSHMPEAPQQPMLGPLARAVAEFDRARAAHDAANKVLEQARADANTAVACYESARGRVRTLLDDGECAPVPVAKPAPVTKPATKPATKTKPSTVAARIIAVVREKKTAGIQQLAQMLKEPARIIEAEVLHLLADKKLRRVGRGFSLT